MAKFFCRIGPDFNVYKYSKCVSHTSRLNRGLRSVPHQIQGGAVREVRSFDYAAKQQINSFVRSSFIETNSELSRTCFEGEANKMTDGLFPWKVKEFLTTVTTAGQPSGGVTKSRPPRMEKRMDGEPDLVSETKQFPIVEVPKEAINRRPSFNSFQDNDWEVLSEKASNCSVGGGGVFVTRAGSVRSITSIDQDTSSSHTTLSVPFKIQRTASSSTIDSQENTLGPSGKGVLGVDYLEHIVMP